MNPSPARHWCPLDGGHGRATPFCAIHHVDLSRSEHWADYRGGVTAPVRRIDLGLSA